MFLQGFSCPTTAHIRTRGRRFLKYLLRSGADPNPSKPAAWRGATGLHLAAAELARGSGGLAAALAGSAAGADPCTARPGLSLARSSPGSHYKSTSPQRAAAIPQSPAASLRFPLATRLVDMEPLRKINSN